MFSFFGFSQQDVATIDIIHFNSTANYGPGSGISVHINPKGIYKMADPSALGNNSLDNNKFILELSDSSGNFDGTNILAEVYDFYTPLINAIIPSETPAGNNYKLRVVATQGYVSESTDGGGNIIITYDQIFTDSDPFVISTDSYTNSINIFSGIPSITQNYFNCHDSDGYSYDPYEPTPYAGSLNRSEGAITPTTSSLNSTFSFVPNEGSTYSAFMYDILNNGTYSQSLSITDAFGIGVNEIRVCDEANSAGLPANTYAGLPIGTYNIEIKEVDNNGISSIYSVIFLWHGNNTNLGNSTSEIICLNEEVIFSIDNSNTGIARNYPSSYYKFDFGDGLPIEYFTHAELMHDGEVKHIYQTVSCNINQGDNLSNYIIEKELYNKFRTSPDQICNNFSENGLGAVKEVNVSQGPEASFTLAETQCETSPIIATNTSTLGQYGSNGSCTNLADFFWYVSWPDVDSFLQVNAIPTFDSWLVGDDLVIPTSFIQSKSNGCWEIYLVGKNQNLCEVESQTPIQTISIETSPDADFNILYNDEIVTEICVNSTVLLDDNSNVSTIECQNPSYQWTISPSTGYSYVNDTGPSSQNPEVLFTEAGLYTITQTITNTCGTNNEQKNLLVLGSPSVEFSPSQDEICLASNGLPYTVDFSNTYRPNYSTTPYAPSSFSWSITGTDVSDSDYSYLNSTGSSSDFPVIEFNSFKDYVITVTVNGDCNDTNNDQFLLKINEIPEISNTDLILDPICSGGFSEAVPLTSTMPGETNFSWERIDENSSTTFFGSTIPSEQIINSCNTPVTVMYRVTPSTEFCTGSPVDFTIQIDPKPVIPDQTAVICSGEEFIISPENNCPTTIVPANTTYEWEVSDNEDIEGAIPSDGPQTEISQELTNRSEIVQYVTYTVTPTSGASGACPGNTFDIVVQVDPEPIIDDITLDPICSGGGFTFDPSDISTNIVPSGTVYEWTVSGSPGTSQGDSQLPADDATAVIGQTNLEVGATPVVLTYTVTPFAPRDNGGHCEGESFDIVVQINPKPVIPDQTAVICSGEEFIISPNNNSTITIVPIDTTYEWEVSDNEDIEGAIPSDGPQTEISQELTNRSEIVQYVTYTVTPTSGASGACPGNTFDIVVQVDPEPIIDDITLDPICSGGGFTFDPSDISTNIVPSGTVYEWTVSGSPGTSQGDSQLPADDATAVIGQTNLEVGATPVVLTYTVTPFAPRDNGGHCEGESFDIVVQINPKPVIPDQTAVICSGEEFNFFPNDGNSYYWGNPVSTPANAISGGSGSDPDVIPTNISQTLTLNPGFNSPAILTYQVTSVSPEGCESEPFNIVVEVNPNGQVDQINDIVVCDGDDVEIEFTTQNTSGAGTGPGSGGRTDYQWEITNYIEIGEPYVGLGNFQGNINSNDPSPPYPFLNFTADNGTGVPITAIIEVTPKFINNGICEGNTMSFSITVNPRPVMDQVESQTICSGTAFDAPIYNSNVSSVDYSWTLVNASEISEFGSDISGYPQSGTYPVSGVLTESIIENDLGIPITLEYELEVEYEGCEGNSVPFLVTVNPSPIVSISPSEPQFICSSGELNEISVSYSYPDTIDVQYQWYYNTTDTNVVTNGVTIAVSAEDGGTSASFTPDSTNSFNTRYYFCVLTFTSTSSDLIVCDEEASPTVEITVGNQPSISSNPEPEQTICLGGTVEEDSLCVTINGGVEDVEYTWHAGFTYLMPDDSFGTFTSNSNCLQLPEDYFDNPSFEGEDIFFWVIVTYPEGNGCGGVFSEAAKVTVLEDPLLSPPSPATQEICQASSSDCLTGTATGGVGSYTFTWYNQDDELQQTGLGSEIDGVMTSEFCPPTDETGTFEYYYVVTTDALGSGCETQSTTAQVIVNQGPSIDVQPLSSQTICLNGTSQDLTVTYINGVGEPTYQWFENDTCTTTGGTAISENGNASSYTPLTTSPGTKYYYVELTFPQGGCGVIASECAEVVIIPDPVATIETSLSHTICDGGEIPDITVSYTGGVGDPTYQWYESTDGGTSFSSVGTDQPTYNPGILSGEGNYQYYVEITFNDNPDNGCDLALSQTVIVQVIPDPVLTPLLATQTVCKDSPATTLEVIASGGVAPYSYQWYNDDGFIPLADASTYTPPTDVVGTFNYYVIVEGEGSGCETQSTTAQVIVNQGPSIDVQPLSSQTICLNGTSQDLTVTYINGVGEPTYQWFENDTCTTTGGTAISENGNASSYTPLTTSPGTKYYYVELTFPQGGCGVIASECAEVVIIPDPVATIETSLSHTICDGGEIPDITVSYTGGVGDPTYQWYESTDGGTSFSSVGTDQPTYNPGILSGEGNYQYYVEITFNDNPDNGCDLALSQTVIVQVIPDPVLTPLLATQTVCKDSPATTLEVIASGGVAPYSYQWYNDDGFIPLADASTYTPPTDVVGTFNYYVIVEGEGSGCETQSTTAQVIVNQGPSIDVQPLSSQTICLNGTSQDLTVTYINGVGEPTYQWFENDTCTTTGGTAISENGNASSYTPLTTSPGTKYYYVELTFPQGGCGVIASECAEVVIIPDPVATIETSLSHTICDGGEIPDITVSYTGGVGDPTYQWYESTDGGTSFSSVGTDQPTYNPGILSGEGNYQYYVEITFNDNPDNGCDLALSQTVIVQVIPDPVLTPLLATQTVCKDSPATTLEVIASGGVAPYSYQWYNDDGFIPLADASTYTPPTDVVGTFNYYVIVEGEGSGCETQSTTAQVIVNQGPSIDVQPLSSQTICLNGTSQDLTVTYINGVGEPTYQWFENDTCTTTGGTAISENGNASSYTPLTTSPGTKYYYVELTFPQGGCGVIASECAEVVIIPDPVATIETSLSHTICDGGEIPDITVSYTGGVGDPTYQWYESTDGGTSFSSVGTDQPTYNPGILSGEGNYQYYVEITFNDNPDNGCDLALSQTVIVQVIPDPVLTPLLATQTVCKDSPATTLEVIASGGVAPYSYQWYNDDGFIPLADASTYTPPTDVVGTFNYYVIVEGEGSGCETQSTTAQVIVNQGPSIDVQPLSSQTICLNGTSQDLTVTYINGVGEPTYQWFENDTCTTTGGTAISENGNASSYTPLTTSPGTKYYYVELTFPQGGCGVIASECAEVVIIPDPVATIETSLSHTICDGGEIPDITVSYTGGVGDPTYQWYESTDGGTSFSSVGTDQPTYNPGILSGEGNYQYYVEITFNDNPDNGCDLALSQTVIVQVIPDPVLTPLLATQTVCKDSPATTLEVIASGGVAPYSYQWYNDDGFIPLADASTYTPPTDVVGTFNYYVIVEGEGSGCETQSTTAQVIVNQGPSIDVQPLSSQTICLNGTSQDLTVTYINGVGEPTYQWFENDTCTTTGGTAISENGNASSYTPLTTSPGTKYYYVELTFPQGGCGVIASECAEVVIIPDPVATIETSLSHTICDGGEIPDITVSYTGGVGDPTYQWYESTDGGTSFSSVGTDQPTYNPGILSGEGNYQYYVEITFNDNPDNGCDLALSQTVIVQVIPDPVLTPLLATQTVCKDSPATTLEVIASGGVAPYSYQWYNDDGFIPLADASTYTPPTDVVGTFNYYVIVEGEGSGCETQSTTAQVIVNQGPSIDVQPLSSQTICLNGTSQDLTVTYINGVGEPTYQWFENDTCTTTGGTAISENGNASSYTPLTTSPGTKYYYVELTFPQGGCGVIASECAEVVIKPIAKIPDVVVEVCDLSSYMLSPQNSLIPDVDTVVPTGTTYTWTYTNNSNITGFAEVSQIDYPQGVGAPNSFNSGLLDNVNPLFNAVETAVFEVTPWTDGCPGPLFTISIAVSPEPEINAEITNIDCSFSEPLCAGTIEVNPVGIAPFTYNWTSPTPGIIINNPSDKDQIELCPGIYQLSITDGSNCTYNYSYEIAPPDPIEFDAIVTDVSCNNIEQIPCDGSIQVTVTGGSLPFDFVQWNRYNELTMQYEPFGSSATFELIGICAGDYLLEIIDANGCQFNSPVYTIEEGVTPINISETFSSFNGYNIDCYGANSGSISIDISGGSGVFEYEFFDGTNTISGNYDTQVNNDPLVFSFLPGGADYNYIFTLLDSNCPIEIVREYTLTQPDELIISAELVNPAECFGDVATYLVTATGGLPPYTGDGLIEVQGGPVTFTVTDANDCQDEFSTVVPEPEELLSTIDVEDALCFEECGVVIINPDGGTPLINVYVYELNGGPDPLISQTTSPQQPVEFCLPVGEYYYEVFDLNLCKYGPEYFTINEPEPLNIVNVEVFQPNCDSDPAWQFNNGSICITLIGGTDPFPIGPGWVDNGGGRWCLDNLSEGIYSIDASDINNCTVQYPIQDIVMTIPTEITASFTDTTTIDCDTNTATQTTFISVNGGIPPYEITWSGPEFIAIPPNGMATSVSGDYSAFVNDQHGIANGCPPIEFPLEPISFFEFGNADFSYSSNNIDFCGIFAVSDPITFFNISSGDIVNYTWNFGDGTQDVIGVSEPSHTYDVIGTYVVSLTVEDLYGCFDTYSESIEITKGYDIILPNAFTPNGDGINDTIRPVYNCMTEVQMSIYDTWGSLIYSESGDSIYGWDGTIDGNPAENGNYIMVVRAVSLNGKTIDLNGPVTLIK